MIIFTAIRTKFDHLLYHNLADLRSIRIPGVLQRFALCYLVVATLHLISVIRVNQMFQKSEMPSKYQLIATYTPEAVSYVGILFIYLYFTFWFNYDESCPKGYQGPGGLDSDAKYFNCTGGAARYLDDLIFGQSHIYQHGTAKPVYKNVISHDPEGLLGVTTSILLTYFGLLVGRILIRERNPYRRAFRWFGLALIVGLIGSVLSLTGLIPIVKNLWSLSFVMVTGAIALFLLLIFYLLIDVAKLWPSGWPFHYPGVNAILLYVGHEVGERYFPFYFHVDGTSHALILFRNCWATSIWLLIAAYLAINEIYFVI